jgi:effector-binding domain-containing protein
VVIALGICTLTAIVLGVAIVGDRFLRGPDLTAYERFRDPTLLTMPTQQVLAVEFHGNTETEGGQAMAALFDCYFRLDGVKTGPQIPAPLGRWPLDVDTPKEQWVGRFALPVPDNVGPIPADLATKYPTARLETWEYGEVAQVLHVGPYTAEAPTIDRLHQFIQLQGYGIVGEHEEEYLRGPGMFGPGNPADYYTLIRYRVQKTRSEAAGDYRSGTF